MEKRYTKRGLPVVGYESPRMDILRFNIRKMMCVSLYGGTEDMRMDGSLDPTENGNVENMGIDNIDF